MGVLERQIDAEPTADAIIATGLRMSLEEFLNWDGEPDRHYQLIDGDVLMMAPTRRGHNVLVWRIGRALENALGDSSGYSIEPETGLLRPGANDTFFETDLLVTAEPPNDKQYAEAPILIVEVLSPSTRHIDRRVKVPVYRSIPSVQEIMLLDQRCPWIEVHRRIEGDRWDTIITQGRDAVLTLAAVPLRLPLAALYRGIGES